MRTLFFVFLFISPSFIFAQNAPDFSDLKYWAAHPDKKDMADVVPNDDYKDEQASSQIDVFFIYPTLFWKKWKDGNYNADVDDVKLNEKVSDSTIKNQASIFNGVGKVYSPMYRQANLKAYDQYTKKDPRATAAFELAYSDVKRAFEYYLKHYNNGRPFIIASHSQGTTHGKMLIKDMVEGTPLMNKLVVAYLVGIKIEKDYFKELRLCKDKNDTGCYCSWRTFKKGYYPKDRDYGDHIACTNPLNWLTDETPASYAENKGAILRNYNKVIPNVMNAMVKDGMLWVSTPNVKFGKFLQRKNWHIADFNFYWVSVRENARHRLNLYWKY